MSGQAHKHGHGHVHGSAAHDAGRGRVRADGHAHAHAHAHGGPAQGGGREPLPGETPAEFWERRYGGDRVWSGRVNHSLAAVVTGLVPGRSLDLGCGEGGDVLWLAEQGWEATGIDLSAAAVGRAREAAAGRGVAARFIAADLADWVTAPASVDGAGDGFDLVTASFLQSPVELPRASILRAAAGRVVPGGRLIIVSHAAAPSWAPDHPGEFPSPAGELELLGLGGGLGLEAGLDARLDAGAGVSAGGASAAFAHAPVPGSWEIEVAEVRSRETAGPNGSASVLDDTVVVVRRLA